MPLRNSAHPAISSAPTLTTATIEACFARRAAPALVTACGSGAHSFAWAARGCASGPARRMLGRADEHGWGTRDAGRWPWRASAGVIKRSRAGLSTVRELLPPRDRPHYPGCWRCFHRDGLDPLDIPSRDGDTVCCLPASESGSQQLPTSVPPPPFASGRWAPKQVRWQAMLGWLQAASSVSCKHWPASANFIEIFT